MISPIHDNRRKRIGKKMNKSNIVDSKYIELNEEHSLKYYKTKIKFR